MSEVTEFSNDPKIYQTLLESTQAIPWKLDWASMKFAYIGPQIETLLGWSRDSWRSLDDWALRLHPDDRERMVNFCTTQSQAGIDHEADYRMLTRDKGYVWIRDVVHVLRDGQGEVEALMGFMFDVSERKQTEDRLLALQSELEALSFKDGLTNIANRRRFNASLELEWANARREQLPLSLLMIDIDYFKQYNDLYGHIRGDQCLVDIAQVLSLALDGPRDLVARFGGEEFVILLPVADAAMAWKVAQRCKRLIHKQGIIHALSPHEHRLTVSIGAGTIVPDEQANSSSFADCIDQQLYAAKKNGRNRIERIEFVF